MKKELHILTLSTILLLTSCGNVGSSLTGSGTSSLLPVSTSPSLSLAACDPITVNGFPTVHTIETNLGTFSLLGVDPIQHEVSAEGKKFLQWIKEQATCVKVDPSAQETFVYLYGKNDLLLNGEIIRGGYALASANEDYLYKLYFHKLEADARQNMTGLWKEKGIPQGKLSSFPIVTPRTLSSHIGKDVATTITIRSIGKGSSGLYFNTEKDYTSPENITLFLPLPLPSDQLSLLSEQADDMLDKTLTVSGRVEVLNKKPMIRLLSRDQLSLQ